MSTAKDLKTPQVPGTPTSPDASPDEDELALDPAAEAETARRRDLVLELVDSMKALDTVTLDLTGKSVMTDFMILTTATSSTHARAIKDTVNLELKKAGIQPDHMERDANDSWVVLDYGDVVLHIFQEDERDYYDLESLWGRPSGVRPGAPSAEADTGTARDGQGGQDADGESDDPANPDRGRSTKNSGSRRHGPLLDRGFRPYPSKVFKPRR